ncbi:uncharacterized protein K441DRAFT_615385, partial [Cenococcum geophilum 1.58]|uniref:uncharacterized protein n=1 Tax=Cenococcum geophilum 1.58 TaxID=794803 RepID=UPI00358E077A
MSSYPTPDVAGTSITKSIVVHHSSVDQEMAVQNSRDLWEKAFQTLADEDALQFDFTTADRLTILKDVLAVVETKKRNCMQRRWKYTKPNGDVIILRDIFEKIATWVNTFKQVGDLATQSDPTHMSLPWAGVRLLLQVSVNDVQTFGAMAEGVEFVSNLITRSAIIEALYLQGLTAAMHQLTQAIIKLYTAILQYILKARRFYDRSTARRMAFSLIQTSETGVEMYLRHISNAQTDVDACMRLVEAEGGEQMKHTLQSIQCGMGAMEEETREKLGSILEDLGKPITRMAIQLSDLHDSLEDSEREKILQWISNVPYMNHHRARLKDCLPGSGRWLFKNEKFVQWRKSSVSSLIWLHGIPGSGKSILVSSVIEHLYSENFENKQAAPISYFYCTRNAAEPERANPDEILRCILEQLSFSGVDPSMREAVVEAYKKKKKEAKGRAPEKLSLSETVELVPLLLENNPAIIVIDALDECDPARRPDLIIALDSIIQESSSLVKVLISSRSDGDIACHLGKWPGVRIEERDNKVDIEKFVRTKVAQAIEERRLIKGNVSKQLEDKIIEALTSGAQGMFRWVSLQIQNLCDSRRIKYEGDVIAELGRLPESLVESYDITYQTISNAGETSRTVAERVMKWLICAQRPLKIQELYAAVSLDSEGKYLVPAIDDLLDACCNMVVPDSELEVFRFAHLSVREYLEKREGYGLLETHKLALERCLDILTRCPTATPSVE